MKDKLTVGEFRRWLEGFSDDTEVTFAGGLTFYRLKRSADKSIFLEFNEFEAELTPAFRKKHPSILVAFCRVDLNSTVEVVQVPQL